MVPKTNRCAEDSCVICALIWLSDPCLQIMRKTHMKDNMFVMRACSNKTCSSNAQIDKVGYCKSLLGTSSKPSRLCTKQKGCDRITRPLYPPPCVARAACLVPLGWGGLGSLLGSIRDPPRHRSLLEDHCPKRVPKSFPK